jgi:formylmethanofuran dehydrogenase subunit E
MEKRIIDPNTVDLDAMIERGTQMHGHLGPFLVAGIRMGLLALELLGSTGYFGINAESDTGSVTPLSCLSDGIQIGSGCTVGKGNLTIKDVYVPRARFFIEGGKGVEITLRPEIVEGFRSGELTAECERIKTRPLEELFAWKNLPSS